MKAKPAKTEDTSLQLALAAADLADDVKAVGITILDLREVSSVADYFVIASGRSHIQVEAICDRIADGVRERLDRRPIAVEGLEQAMWGILDYGSVVVHVFQESVRELYDLERLWNLAPRWKHGEKPPKSVTGGAEAAKPAGDKASAAKKSSAKGGSAKSGAPKSAAPAKSASATKAAASAKKAAAGTAASSKGRASSGKAAAKAATAKPATAKPAAKPTAKSATKTSAKSSAKPAASASAKAPAKKATAAKKPAAAAKKIIGKTVRKTIPKTASPEA